MATQTGEAGGEIAAPGQGRLYRGLVSAFLVLALGAQIATFGVTLVNPGWLRAKLYPIIEYPMYAQAHYDNERVTGRWLLQGELTNGAVIDITEESLHTTVWDFILLTDPVAVGKPNAPQTLSAIKTLVTVVREREPRAAELKALRIENYPLKVTRHGAETIPSQTVVTIPMQPELATGH